MRFVNTTDIEVFYEWYLKGSIFFRHLDDFLSLEEFRIQLSMLKCLTIYDEEDIGLILLRIKPKPKICEVSIMLREDKRCQGKALEAMKEVIKYLFDNGIERVVCLVADDRTKELCEEGGFEQEGVYKNSCKYNGLLMDEIRFGLDKETFRRLYG